MFHRSHLRLGLRYRRENVSEVFYWTHQQYAIGVHNLKSPIRYVISKHLGKWRQNYHTEQSMFARKLDNSEQVISAVYKGLAKVFLSYIQPICRGTFSLSKDESKRKLHQG